MKQSRSGTNMYDIRLILSAVFLIIVGNVVTTQNVDAFQPSKSTTISSSSSSSTTIAYQAAKGFGGASPKNTKNLPKPTKKTILKQLETTYGGTTPEDIARGTQRRIDATLQSQPSYIQLAIPIYQQLQQWNQRMSGMTVLQQTEIPVEEMEGAKRARNELERLMNEHDFTGRDLHNLIQQATWDASADAKVARSMTGEMSTDIQKRVQVGCDVAMRHAQTLSGNEAQILDVGCGYGVLVPFLKKAGFKDSQIHGIDLSSEMIHNAKRWYPDCHLEAIDFYSYEPPPTTKKKFDVLIFCSSLHDLPDMMTATLPKARDLLHEQGGTLILLHPQGASHVQNQVRTNPSMVPRGLPTAEELRSLTGFELIQEPASPKSKEENRDGYLAVLERIG